MWKIFTIARLGGVTSGVLYEKRQIIGSGFDWRTAGGWAGSGGLPNRQEQV
jgi:hypothetical protein